MRAYYFSNKDKRLRYGDNRLITEGGTHTVDCKPKCCEQGLHGSIRALDALKYAPDSYIWIVDIEGDIDTRGDKICGKSRTYIKGFDAEELLWEFARKQALINIEKIKPYCSQGDYDTILEYLNTGVLREVAREAARAAAETAEAAEAAAWEARAAAETAEAAAWEARVAARAVAWAAAKTAAEAATAVAWAAAKTTANAAADAANEMLEQMIKEHIKELESKEYRGGE